MRSILNYILREEKIVFGSFKKKPNKPATQGFTKPNIPIKEKDARVGSLRKSLLSFDEDDLWYNV